MQHVTRIALGTGLLTTFLIYAINIVNQVWRVLRDLVCLVTDSLSRIFHSFILYILFSVTSLQLNFAHHSPLEFLGSTLIRWNYRLHSDIPLHGLKMPIYLKCLLSLCLLNLNYWYMLFERIVSVLSNFCSHTSLVSLPYKLWGV